MDFLASKLPPKPRVLITGGSGLLALNWAQAIRSDWDVILGIHKRQVSLDGTHSMPIDLTDCESLTLFLEKKKPDLVIHTVALTDVELCEREPDLAYHINAELAKNVALACHRIGIKLVHISTDHLFDGKKAYCTELDAVCPLNIYGKTKAQAEEFVLGVCPEALIVRTNFYGWGPSYRPSFSDSILKALREEKKIKIVQDVYFSPLISSELSKSVHCLLDQNAFGIFHIVGNERLAKHEFALSLAKMFNLNCTLVEPFVTLGYNTQVVRPKDMSLSNKKLHKFLKCTIGGVSEHLNYLKNQELNGVSKELANL